MRPGAQATRRSASPAAAPTGERERMARISRERLRADVRADQGRHGPSRRHRAAGRDRARLHGLRGRADDRRRQEHARRRGLPDERRPMRRARSTWSSRTPRSSTPVAGIVKADIGIRDGRIVGIGKAGNPDIMDGVDRAPADGPEHHGRFTATSTSSPRAGWRPTRISCPRSSATTRWRAASRR